MLLFWCAVYLFHCLIFSLYGVTPQHVIGQGRTACRCEIPHTSRKLMQDKEHTTREGGAVLMMDVPQTKPFMKTDLTISNIP